MALHTVLRAQALRQPQLQTTKPLVRPRAAAGPSGPGALLIPSLSFIGPPLPFGDCHP